MGDENQPAYGGKKQDIVFDEAILDKLSPDQLADLVSKTVRDHQETARSFMKSLMRSAIRSTLRSPRE